MPKRVLFRMAPGLALGLLAVVLGLFAAQTAFAGNAEWRLSVSGDPGAGDGTLQVNIGLADAAAAYSFDILVRYDPAVLQFGDARLAAEFGVVGSNAMLINDTGVGSVRLIGTRIGDTGGADGDVDVVRLSFRPLAASASTAIVLVEGATVSDAHGVLAETQAAYDVVTPVAQPNGAGGGAGGGGSGGGVGGGGTGGGPGGGSPGGAGPDVTGGGEGQGASPVLPDNAPPMRDAAQVLTYSAEDAERLFAEGKAMIAGNGSAQFTVKLPVAAMLAGGSLGGGAAAITLTNGGAAYTLPASAVAAALSEWSAEELARAELTVSITKLEEAGEWLQTAAADGMTPVTDFIDFRVSIAIDGRTYALQDFGRVYVTRSISMPSDVLSTDGLTGVTFDAEADEFRFVPTVFERTAEGWRAVFKRPGNSVYAVLRYKKTFRDIERHWGRGDIEALASLRIINGVSADRFEPDRRITRAEFAALLVRSLGLPMKAERGTFADVPAGAWFADDVHTAYEAGIVSGRTATTFDPNAVITRQEMAAMIGKAAAFVGIYSPSEPLAGSAIADSGHAGGLDAFADASRIAGYARPYVEYVVAQGIVNGTTPTTFAPERPATRAEAAAMLHRMLRTMHFIP